MGFAVSDAPGLDCCEAHLERQRTRRKVTTVFTALLFFEQMIETLHVRDIYVKVFHAIHYSSLKPSFRFDIQGSHACHRRAHA